MRKTHKKLSTQQQIEHTVANRLGWTIDQLHWFARAARAYVQLHGASALMGLKSK